VRWLVGLFATLAISSASTASTDGMLKTIYCHISEMNDGRCYEKANQLCPDGFKEISRRHKGSFTAASETLELDFVCKKKPVKIY
jgi:hypothetical protein